MVYIHLPSIFVIVKIKRHQNLITWQQSLQQFVSESIRKHVALKIYGIITLIEGQEIV